MANAEDMKASNGLDRWQATIGLTGLMLLTSARSSAAGQLRWRSVTCRWVCTVDNKWVQMMRGPDPR